MTTPSSTSDHATDSTYRGDTFSSSPWVDGYQEILDSIGRAPEGWSGYTWYFGTLLAEASLLARGGWGSLPCSPEGLDRARGIVAGVRQASELARLRTELRLEALS